MKQAILVVVLLLGASAGQYNGYRLGFAEATAGLGALKDVGMIKQPKVDLTSFIDNGERYGR